MNFLSVSDLNREEIYAVLDRANELRSRWRRNDMPQTLKNQRIALWFYGQGFRNRMAFEIGARAMGADVSFIPGELGIHEPIEDIARYLDNWFSLLVIRCKNHTDLEKVAADSKAPVINARTTFNHPCEIIGDLQFIYSKRKTVDNLNVVFVGETTNLCMSWFEAARSLPINVVQIGPKAYLAPDDRVEEINRGAIGRVSTSETFDGFINVDTDVLYTDCWPKGGDASEVSRLFGRYQITKSIVAEMNPRGFYLPCPPITRGQEISADSLSAGQYCDYEAKEYLLHSQNAIMEYCIR
jgi:ornithine carbamoyltransferase